MSRWIRKWFEAIDFARATISQSMILEWYFIFINKVIKEKASWRRDKPLMPTIQEYYYAKNQFTPRVLTCKKWRCPSAKIKASDLITFLVSPEDAAAMKLKYNDHRHLYVIFVTFLEWFTWVARSKYSIAKRPCFDFLNIYEELLWRCKRNWFCGRALRWLNFKPNESMMAMLPIILYTLMEMKSSASKPMKSCGRCGQ